MQNINGNIPFSPQIFGSYYLSSKELYLRYFGVIPHIMYVNDIDGEKSYQAFKEKYAARIKTTHSYRGVDQYNKDVVFDDTYLVLDDQTILEFSNAYCQILHDGTNERFLKEIVGMLRTFKEKARRKPREINIIIRGRERLALKPMEIKKKKLDIDLFYEDDFKEVDKLIRQRLNQKNDKGILLLHGLPGSGKTTYLRYLIGRIRKKILFLSPNIAGNLTDPDFIDLLVNNPNSVVVIEDAENVIMDRKTNPQSSVSNLLNISDGLLADFLNVQLICTFNSSVALIDSALTRKGRLIARYEFGKLSVAKAQRLSQHLGHNKIIKQPMTIAEIANPHELQDQSHKVQVIGFRRQELEKENVWQS